MSNITYDDMEMYNSELKKSFIERYSENTHNAYARIFYNSKYTEELYNLDLYEFNLEQISDVIRSLNPSSLASAKSIISIIRSYIDWAIAYRSNNINPLDTVDTIWAKQFLDENLKLFFSKDEIDEIISKCVNAQDAVIISLLFEGAGGKRVSEIRNLTPHDVDTDNNVLTLTDDDKNKRKLHVSQQCIDLVIEAIKQKDYYKQNGDISSNARNTKMTSDLLETGFVIKPAKTKNKYLEQVNTHVVYGRLATISEKLGLENFTVNNIKRSGMIYMAKQILERDGYFDNKDQYFEICERYGVNKFDNHGYETYYWYGMKEYVNTELIEQLYGESSQS